MSPSWSPPSQEVKVSAFSSCLVHNTDLNGIKTSSWVSIKKLGEILEGSLHSELIYESPGHKS